MNQQIILGGTEDLKNKKSWSGTHYAIYKSMQNLLNNVCLIDYSHKTSFLKYLHSFTSRNLLKTDGALRDPLINWIQERILLRYLRSNSLGSDIPMLHISSIAVPLKDMSRVHAMYTDATIEANVKYGDLEKDSRYYKTFVKSTVKYLHRLNYIFTFNEWTKESLINDFQVDGRKIYNVRFGINVEPYYEDKNYNNKSILIVLRPGTEKKKGLLLLLQAFKIVQQTIPDIKLNVIGTDVGENISGIKFYKDYPREFTKKMFKESSLYAMPALNEVNGITYLEALASKTPILGLNRLAFPEFSGYGKYGFICEEPVPESVANNIINAFSDINRLRDMGKQGQAFVKNNYNWDKTVNSILDIMFKKTKP